MSSGEPAGGPAADAAIRADATRRVAAVLAQLEADRDVLAAAGEADGVAAHAALIDAARTVLDNLRPVSRRGRGPGQ